MKKCYEDVELWVVKLRNNKKYNRKVLGSNRYIGFIGYKGKKFTFIPEAYNSLGTLIWMMKDQFACYATSNDGSCCDIDKSDLTDTKENFEFEVKEYFDDLYSAGMDIHDIGDCMKILFDINIDNRGEYPFKKTWIKCGITSNKNIDPRVVNTRYRNVLKAYKLVYNN